jgi:hypothetical protein
MRALVPEGQGGQRHQVLGVWLHGTQRQQQGLQRHGGAERAALKRGNVNARLLLLLLFSLINHTKSFIISSPLPAR